MAVVGIGSTASVDPVASLVTALNTATAAVTAATAALAAAAVTDLKRDALNLSFTFVTVTATGADSWLPSAGTVRWADGTTGTFSGATFDTMYGDYTGYTVTYAGSPTKTLTVAGTSFDSYGHPYGTTVTVT